MENKNIVFIIPSVIYFVDLPLSYSHTRSVFSPEERAKQTVKTIHSIRSKVPNAKIILIELGLKEALPYNLNTLADSYVYLGHRCIVRQAVDSKHKGLGEATGLWLANRNIQSLNGDYYFKLSGRYYLNDEFSLDKWLNDGFMAYNGNGWISTRLYGFSENYYQKWRDSLKLSMPALKRGEAIENAMPRYVKATISHMDTLGVSGIVAPWNENVSE